MPARCVKLAYAVNREDVTHVEPRMKEARNNRICFLFIYSHCSMPKPSAHASRLVSLKVAASPRALLSRALGRTTRPRPHLYLEREHVDETLQQPHVVEPARSAGGTPGAAEHASILCRAGATRYLLVRLLGEAAPHLLRLRIGVGFRARLKVRVRVRVGVGVRVRG